VELDDGSELQIEKIPRHVLRCSSRIFLDDIRSSVRVVGIHVVKNRTRHLLNCSTFNNQSWT